VQTGGTPTLRQVALASYVGSAAHLNYSTDLVLLIGILGGGVPPVISEYLLDRYGSWSIAVMLAGLAMVSLMSVRLLKETAQPR
jgi:hypothetical protein